MVHFHPHVDEQPPFSSTHAEREVSYLRGAAREETWTAPNGRTFALRLPPTVYPPREDTDLMAKVLKFAGLKPGQSLMEIGCGSGALSLYAASEGCEVVACDINPYAVSCTRAHLTIAGLQATVHEGGPGPAVDGGPDQWAGAQPYDVVVWNMPYLSSNTASDGMLGPLEEASLLDTDTVGLFPRTLDLIAQGNLLAARGIGFFLISSKGSNDDRLAQAWRVGLGATVVEQLTFEDGECISVLAVWRPFEHATNRVVEEVHSTNTALMATTDGFGSTLRADMQTDGRGRRQRSWLAFEGALFASWVVGEGEDVVHEPLDQVVVGVGLVRLIRHLAPSYAEHVSLKWPNDVYLRSEASSPWKKVAGILFEASTKGAKTRIVGGIGVNRSCPDTRYAGLDAIGWSGTAADLHRAIHAMLASHYEAPHLSVPLPSWFRPEAGIRAVLEGVDSLGPIFYRNNAIAAYGLTQEGQMLLGEGDVVVDDPDDLMWSNIQFGVEDFR